MSKPIFALRPTTPAIPDTQFTIGGHTIRVYGLDAEGNVPSHNGRTVLAVLAHPRLQTYKYSEILARELIAQVPGLVCAVYDLPNHGVRETSHQSNLDWAKGNPTHAQDLISMIDLGAYEIALIAEHLPGYIPGLQKAANEGKLVTVASGVSLGGHIAWRIAVDPNLRRLFSGIAPIIGCPVIPTLLENRTKIQQPDVDASVALPNATRAALKVWAGSKDLYELSDFRILALCGRNDTLVPAKYTEEWAQGVIHTDKQKVFVQDGVGHWTSPEAVDKLAGYLKEFF